MAHGQQDFHILLSSVVLQVIQAWYSLEGLCDSIHTGEAVFKLICKTNECSLINAINGMVKLNAKICLAVQLLATASRSFKR